MNGTITAHTVIAYLGYRSAMSNFELRFKKSKGEIEKIQVHVGVVNNPENIQLTIEKQVADSLEAGRKVAAQE